MNLSISNFKNIVILTGAGVSVASGIKPFRGTNGLWNDPSVERMSSITTLKSDPIAVLKFWTEMRLMILTTQPNPAHTALSQMESTLRPDQNFLLITQNIDGLHTNAGSVKVAELHGNILRARCSNETCAFKPVVDTSGKPNPRGRILGGYMRRDIVFSGVSLPGSAEWN